MKKQQQTSATSALLPYPIPVPVQLPLHHRRLLRLGPQHVHLVRQAPAGLLRALQLLLCIVRCGRKESESIASPACMLRKDGVLEEVRAPWHTCTRRHPPFSHGRQVYMHMTAPFSWQIYTSMRALSAWARSPCSCISRRSCSTSPPRSSARTCTRTHMS